MQTEKYEKLVDEVIKTKDINEETFWDKIDDIIKLKLNLGIIEAEFDLGKLYKLFLKRKK